jgi:hypothetical protein
MGDIINLRQVRKARARAEAEAIAAEHRIQFGRTKAERKEQDTERRRDERHVDGHRLDDKND